MDAVLAGSRPARIAAVAVPVALAAGWAALASRLGVAPAGAALAALAGALLLAHRPAIGVFLIVAVHLWAGSVGVGLGGVVNLLLPVALAAIWALGLLHTRRLPHPLPGILLPWFAVFTTWIALSGLVNGTARYAAIELLWYAMLVVILLLVWNLLTRRALGIALLLLAAGLALTSLFVLRDVMEAGLAEYFFSRTLYTNRPLGPFLNPNFLGVAMAHGGVIAFARLVAPEAPPLPRGGRLALVGIVLLLTAGVILSLSRGSMLYLGAGGLVLALQHPRVRALVLGGGLVTAGILAVSSVPAWVLLRLRVQGGASGREDLWQAGLEMARQNPWFGVGPGNFEPLRNRFLSSETIWFLGDMRGGGSHNALIHRAAELGVPGLVLGALLFAVLLFHVPGALRRYRSGNWVAGFGAAAAFGLMLHAQFEILPTVGAVWPSMNLVFFLAALVLLAGDRPWPAEERASG